MIFFTSYRRSIIRILFSLICVALLIKAQAQSEAAILYPLSSYSHAISYKDFITHNIKTVKTYFYKIKKNGTLKRDSTLLISQEIFKAENSIRSVTSDLLIVTHGPSSFIWNKFEEIYDTAGHLLKRIDEPLNITKRKEYGALKYNISKTETVYKYNKDSKIENETVTNYNNYYSISKYTKDTFHLYSVHPEITEFFYDENGKEIQKYYTDDSTKYLPVKYSAKDTIEAKCYGCRQRYLNSTKEYDSSSKLILYTWFTSKGEVHSKKYYYYDLNDSLVKIIDSTGWYIGTIKPYIEYQTDYAYTDSNKSIITSYNKGSELSGGLLRKTQIYNKEGLVIKDCTDYTTSGVCTNYKYESRAGRIILVTETDNNNQTRKEYYYNQRDLLSEIKIFFNNKLRQVVKRHYVFE